MIILLYGHDALTKRHMAFDEDGLFMLGLMMVFEKDGMMKESLRKEVKV